MVTRQDDEEWCDYSDMPKWMCDHCLQGSDTVDKAEMRKKLDAEGFAVAAKFEGSCSAGCGEPIEVGEYIVRVRGGNGWMHEECS